MQLFYENFESELNASQEGDSERARNRAGYVTGFGNILEIQAKAAEIGFLRSVKKNLRRIEKAVVGQIL